MVIFEELLNKTMGMDAASIGPSMIRRAVSERSAACQCADLATYWDFVSQSPTELQQLIEAVVVPETWFFRDREAFATLARVAVQQWWPAHPEKVLRLLSLPCSTGEEPFTMVMALQDAGLPLSKFRVDAFDISERALVIARRGIYGKNSFRGKDVVFRDRFFEPHEGAHRLSESVRSQVRFEQGNMLHPGFLSGAETYDIIFCRNVLIYFDRPTQERAIALLSRLLAPGGILFVGPSESGLLLSHGFASAKIPLAFAFKKETPAVPVVKAPPREAIVRRPVFVPPVRLGMASRPAVKTVLPQQAAVATSHPLEAATRLADQGRLGEAGVLCAAYMKTHGPSAQVYYLMGLIHDAAGELDEAIGDYRKALYLNPSHHESLLHLAFILEKQGNASGAQVLRNRARRL
ncbi:MAG: putative methyltransferase [Chthoniobacteraceae bacterium]|nr:putative methyltransferase [Chthoniobacteraceae bacterium]